MFPAGVGSNRNVVRILAQEESKSKNDDDKIAEEDEEFRNVDEDRKLGDEAADNDLHKAGPLTMDNQQGLTPHREEQSDREKNDVILPLPEEHKDLLPENVDTSDEESDGKTAKNERQNEPKKKADEGQHQQQQHQQQKQQQQEQQQQHQQQQQQEQRQQQLQQQKQQQQQQQQPQQQQQQQAEKGHVQHGGQLRGRQEQRVADQAEEDDVVYPTYVERGPADGPGNSCQVEAWKGAGGGGGGNLFE